ncbi:F0F1 ATP synthase subunit epsilon [Glacieibacterium sp.]|uniref:F0F1 ATP synthase subunit epsilon n=1 Tax=Glacieibacterium sp. TaxID=2860237 RepID=UPI003B00DD1E
MADTLHFELVSPERLLRSADVYMVVVPGTEGDFGVLVGHAPFMSTIRPGAISVYPNGMNDVPERIFIDGGFAEVGANGLTILAESAVPVSELDVEAAATGLAEAREMLRAATSEIETKQAEKRIATFEAMQAATLN